MEKEEIMDRKKPFQIYRSMKDLRERQTPFATFPAQLKVDAWETFRQMRSFGYVLAQDGFVIGFYGVVD